VLFVGWAGPTQPAIICDLNDMKNMGTARGASEELLAQILDNAAEAIISIDESQRITMFNQGAERVYGYSAEEVLGKPVELLMPARFIGVHRQHVLDFAAAPEKARRIAEGVKVFGRRKDGSEFPAEASISKLTLADGTIFTVILWDITERKKAEEELKRSREELRILAARLQQAREEERAVLAREIHDQLSGALTALKMDLSFLANRVPQGDAALTAKTRAMSSLIDTTLSSVRNIATQLRPSVLDDLGLIAAIEWQAEEFQNRSGIQCHLDLEREEVALDRNRSTAIFRIFQEALTNIAQHAKASEVWISLHAQPGSLMLQIRDNGRGITQEEISSSKSLGLLGMRERAFAFGGEVVIATAPKQGTTVAVKIPVNQE
jgi:PAS domain S-box-containing protein